MRKVICVLMMALFLLMTLGAPTSTGVENDYPLKAEPRTVEVTLMEGQSIVKDIKITNVADHPVKGTLGSYKLLCGASSPGVEIIGNDKVDLAANASMKIKVEISAASLSSEDCMDLYLHFKDENGDMVQKDIAKFTIKTTPGFGCTGIVIGIVVGVALIVALVFLKLRKKRKGPQYGIGPTPKRER